MSSIVKSSFSPPLFIILRNISLITTNHVLVAKILVLEIYVLVVVKERINLMAINLVSYIVAYKNTSTYASLVYEIISRLCVK